MFEFPQVRALQGDPPSYSQAFQNASALQGAHRLFRKMFEWGRFRRVAFRLLKKPYQILDIASVKDALYQGCHQSSGIRAVPVDCIHGTESRMAEFDYYFYPITIRIRDRWINIASLSLLNVSLPPVELICIKDIFFVRDGHHRVSVARALGQHHIDAEVLNLRKQTTPGEQQWITIRS